MKVYDKFPLTLAISTVLLLSCLPAQAQLINTDYYYRFTNMFLKDDRSLETASTKGQPIFMGYTSGSRGQKWKLTALPNGKYSFSNNLLGANRCVDAYDNNVNTPHFNYCDDNPTESWTLESAGNDYYFIIDSHGRALDNEGSGNFKPVLSPKGNYSGQFWKLTRLEAVSSLENSVVLYDGQAFDGEAYILNFNPGFMKTAADGYNQLSVMPANWKNRISSIQVPGGYKIIAYKEPNFQGSYYMMPANWSAADFPDMDNQIASLRILQTNAPLPATPVTVNTPVITQPTATLSTTHFYSITNKAEDEQFKLFYANNVLQLITTPGKWRMVPVKTKGFWYQENNMWYWKEDHFSNRYRIEMYTDGRYYAIYGSSTSVYPNIANVNPDDKRQVWIIELQSDGYYKITNEELAKANNPNAVLFCATDKRLNLSKWVDLQTLNGRWKLIPGELIPKETEPQPQALPKPQPKTQPQPQPKPQPEPQPQPQPLVDKFDNKRLTLISVKTNQPICAAGVFLDDSDMPILLVPCLANNMAKFIFQKTKHAGYVLKVEFTSNSGVKYVEYFGRLMRAQNPSEFNLEYVEPEDTWKIIDMGNGQFVIRNFHVNIDKVFELSKVGKYSANCIVLNYRQSKAEQLWYLHE